MSNNSCLRIDDNHMISFYKDTMFILWDCESEQEPSLHLAECPIRLTSLLPGIKRLRFYTNQDRELFIKFAEATFYLNALTLCNCSSVFKATDEQDATLIDWVNSLLRRYGVDAKASYEDFEGLYSNVDVIPEEKDATVVHIKSPEHTKVIIHRGGKFYYDGDTKACLDLSKYWYIINNAKLFDVNVRMVFAMAVLSLISMVEPYYLNEMRFINWYNRMPEITHAWDIYKEVYNSENDVLKYYVV